ncbi:hypothetical protein QTP86_019321, partial [Hemibagrus guttatus]
VPNENGNFSLSAVHSISFDDCEVEGLHLSSLQSTIQKCPSLQQLQFSQLTMGADGADFLTSVLPSLKNLRILSLNSKGETEDEAVIFALQQLQKHVEWLSLSRHVIKDSGAAVLRNALQGLTRIRSLRLDSLELDEESLACFAQGLQAMTSLKKISLNIKTSSKDGSGILCLLASLHTLFELEEIELIGLRIGDQGIEELVKHIPKWTRLRKINLSRNNLGQSFAAVMGQVLPLLSELSELNLTSIGTSDLVNVASCLKHCTSIEDISLSWNSCENDVVLKLVEVLPQCSKLKRLDLEANNIYTSGAKALAGCLQFCPWIEIIRLWRNPIKKDDPILKDKRLNFSPT